MPKLQKGGIDYGRYTTRSPWKRACSRPQEVFRALRPPKERLPPEGLGGRAKAGNRTLKDQIALQGIRGEL